MMMPIYLNFMNNENNIIPTGFLTSRLFYVLPKHRAAGTLYVSRIGGQLLGIRLRVSGMNKKNPIKKELCF